MVFNKKPPGGEGVFHHYPTPLILSGGSGKVIGS